MVLVSIYTESYSLFRLFILIKLNPGLKQFTNKMTLGCQITKMQVTSYNKRDDAILPIGRTSHHASRSITLMQKNIFNQWIIV